MQAKSIDGLHGVAAFSVLSAAERVRLAQQARIRNYAARAVIYRQGDPGDAVYAVLSGYLKAECWGPEGNALLVCILGVGDIFGELSLLDGQPRGATITVLESGTMAVIGREAFESLLASCPALSQRFFQILGARLRKLAQRCETQNSADLSARLAAALTGIGEKHGRRDAAGQLRIPVRLSRQELGSLVGASRESVNKLLRHWSANGLLVHERGHVTIRRPNMFRELTAAAEGRLSA